MGVAGNSAHVLRVDPESGEIFRQPVIFETLSRGNAVRVKTGLSVSDLVVADGTAFVRQGQKVRYELVEPKGDIK